MPTDRLCFAFVSTSHYRKGLDILLEAFAGLDPERFALFVAGSPVSSSLPHVHSLGFLKNPAALYAAADFYLHPARYEPFGQIVTEALQCGTPVLVSDRVGAKEILSPQEGRVIESLAPEAWREAILALPGQEFSIGEEVGREKELLLEQHMHKMMEWAAKNR
jgi:glycosyltransferase involved in cell wall biosynthesis